MTSTKSPIIVAHRGLHQEHPENSLLAFRSAWAKGIIWCECDVHLTRDDTPVVIHDETLERTTTGSGAVRSVPFESLSGIRLRSPAGRSSDEELPTLWRVLRAMPRDARLLVEIKPAGAAAVDRVVRVIRGEGCELRCLVQSFSKENVKAAAELDPPMSVAWLIEEPDQLLDAYDCDCPRIHVRHDLLDEMTIRPLRREGKSVGVWTVNEERDLRRVIELGVDMIITDQPLLARQVMESIA